MEPRRVLMGLVCVLVLALVSVVRSQTPANLQSAVGEACEDEEPEPTAGLCWLKESNFDIEPDNPNTTSEPVGTMDPPLLFCVIPEWYVDLYYQGAIIELARTFTRTSPGKTGFLLGSLPRERLQGSFPGVETWPETLSSSR